MFIKNVLLVLPPLIKSVIPTGRVVTQKHKLCVIHVVPNVLLISLLLKRSHSGVTIRSVRSKRKIAFSKLKIEFSNLMSPNVDALKGVPKLGRP